MATLLVVDDELAIARLLEDVLVDEGHRVLLAGNGKRAYEIAVAEKPALVLTDFMMPVMDGAGLLQTLATHAGLKDVPVIMMSSMPESVVAERCTGYASFVRKPFSIFSVIALVSQLVGRNGTR